MKTLEVGQTLWCVITFRHGRNFDPPKQGEATVTKVGNKYATLSTDDRIVIETGIIDGGRFTSPGKCYLSKEEYDATDGTARAWRALRVAVSSQHALPKDVTLADINAARALLKI